jgi:hypothetical protein
MIDDRESKIRQPHLMKDCENVATLTKTIRNLPTGRQVRNPEFGIDYVEFIWNIIRA